jgi:hypothetical protein
MGDPDLQEVVLYWGPEAGALVALPMAAVTSVTRAAAVGPVIFVTEQSRADGIRRLVDQVLPGDWASATYDGGKGINSRVKVGRGKLRIDAQAYGKSPGVLKGLSALHLVQKDKAYCGVILVVLLQATFGCLAMKRPGEPRTAPASGAEQPAPGGCRLGPPVVPQARTEGEQEAEYSWEIDAGFIGTSAAARDIKRRVALAAAAPGPDLVSGPAGSGHRLIARLIHRTSGRATSGPMVAVMCEAIAQERAEAEWFGAAPGACGTGQAGQEGYFHRARHGTIYLDEVGALSAGDQARLVSVLADKAFRPVGASCSVDADVRVVAATRRDLQAMVDAGQFRGDLFERLNVFPIRTRALTEMADDLIGIARHLWARILFERAHAAGTSAPPVEAFGAIDNEVADLIARFPWPGNARQLHTYLARVLTLAGSDRPTTDVFRRAFGVEQGVRAAVAQDA